VTLKRILLVGMMGVGKSTVGRALSEQTGWPYVDNDELLHADTGMYGAELLAHDGVQALRDAEAHVLSEVVQREPPLIAGIAAGVVLRPDDRQRISRAGFVVWLRARTETLVQRIGDDHDRAWLQPDPTTALRELAAGRDPLYAEVADLIVDVDDHAVADTVQEILRALG
jgi:shikimate kinase